MDSRRRRTPSISRLKLKEPAPSSQPTSTDSRTKSPHREARRGRQTNARKLSRLQYYIQQSRSSTQQIDRDPPKVDNGNGHGCEVNNRAPRSRSTNRRQHGCEVNNRAPRSRSTNSRRPRQSNLGSDRRSSLPGQRNPSPATTPYTRSVSPSSRSRSSKSQQQQYTSSRNSHARANSKERYNNGSHHHQDSGINDNRQISNDGRASSRLSRSRANSKDHYDNGSHHHQDSGINVIRGRASSRLSRSRVNSKDRYDKDFGNSDSKLKVAHNHENIKNSSSYDETSHHNRSNFAETKKNLNNAPTADDRVVRSMVEDIAPAADEHAIRSIVEAVMHQLKCKNANSHREERNGQRGLRSSIQSSAPPDSEKMREKTVAQNENRDSNVDKIISQISRVKERNVRGRSRGRSRSKSRDGRMKNSSSSSTLTMTTKSSHSTSSGCASAITSESKTSKSLVSSELKLSLEYMCNKLAETEPASSIPVISPSNIQEGAPCPRRMAPSPIGKKNVPPPRPDLSSRSISSTPSYLSKPKSQPPPPPPHRRNMNNNNRVAPTTFTATASRSRARSRSRDRRQLKKDNNQERHSSGGQGGHNKIISPGSSSMNASKMSCSAPPPPHRPPPHRSASMGVIVSVENIGDARSVPPPPMHTRQGRSSTPDISASGNSLLCHKASPPPPPPARRMSTQASLQDHGQSRSSLFNSSSTSLNNTINTIPTSHAIVPMSAISTTQEISNATNQPQLQTHRSRKNKNHPVSSMGYIDPYGDSGVYSGEVDDESRPHGKGKMKYDNGVFYEGNWTHGSKDETQGDASGDKLTNVTRDRMLSGFTSWKGQGKKDGKGKDKGDSDGRAFVYGMEWVDLVGTPGKYTGQVNADNEPEGKGVMKYDFGLVAEGKWIKGKLNDGAGGGMGSGIMAQSVAGGMSVAPDGMSVAPGGISVAGSAGTAVSGLGMMSICGGGGGGMMMGGYPNGMLNQYINPNMPMAATYYNPAGAMMAGAPVAVNYQQQPGVPMSHPDAMSGGGTAHVPTNNIALGEKK